MTRFTEAIAHARDTEDPQWYIESVKRAVREEFSRIDSTVRLDDTSYFNHSAVPDFMMVWPDHSERRLYLRNSYESIVAANDAVRFDASRPMVLTLTERADETQPEELAQTGIVDQSEHAPNTLITGPTALSAVSDSDSENSDGPVAELVRVNLARGGRGLLTPQKVGTLLRVQARDGDEGRTYAERLSENFLPEAAQRIVRTAELIELAKGDDFSSLEMQLEDSATRGRLTPAEIRHLLPWLLTNSEVTTDRRFWSYLGTLVNFADLDNLREDLSEVILNPLVTANMDEWAGKRAYIGQANLPTENADPQEIAARDEGVWSIIGPTLGVNIGDKRLHLAPSGSRLRGRDGSSSALWADLSAALGGFKVASVKLTGVSRSIAVNAEDSDDITQDIEDITESVDDTYYVRTLGLAFPAADGDGDTEVSVKFDAEIVSSERDVTLSDLAETALKVLQYRQPVEDGTLDVLLGRAEEEIGAGDVESEK